MRAFLAAARPDPPPPGCRSEAVRLAGLDDLLPMGPAEETVEPFISGAEEAISMVVLLLQ